MPPRQVRQVPGRGSSPPPCKESQAGEGVHGMQTTVLLQHTRVQGPRWAAIRPRSHSKVRVKSGQSPLSPCPGLTLRLALRTPARAQPTWLQPGQRAGSSSPTGHVGSRDKGDVVPGGRGRKSGITALASHTARTLPVAAHPKAGASGDQELQAHVQPRTQVLRLLSWVWGCLSGIFCFVI